MLRIPPSFLLAAAIAFVGGCGKIKDASQSAKDALTKAKPEQSKEVEAAKPPPPPAPTGGSGQPPPPAGLSTGAPAFPGGEVYPADPAKLASAFQEIGRVVVVDFYTDWCAPCKHMAPIMEELAREYSKEVVFLSVNADNEQELVKRYNIKSVPDIRVFVNGKPSDGWIGLASRAKAKEIIEKAISARLPAPVTGPPNNKPPIETTLVAPPSPPPAKPAPGSAAPPAPAPHATDATGGPAPAVAPPIQERRDGDVRLPDGMRPY